MAASVNLLQAIDSYNVSHKESFITLENLSERINCDIILG